MADYEVKVGPYARQNDGTMFEKRRGNEFGDQVMVQGQPFFAEAVRRGQVFVASTAVAGVAPGTALSTTPPFALWNPVGSGKL